MSQELEFLNSREFKNRLKAESTDVSKLVIRKHFAAEEVKQIGDDTERTVRFVISTGSVDRDKDTINPNGWDVENYKMNPVVLFAHDGSRPPIGRAKNIFVEDDMLKADAQFMPNDIDTSGFSDMIFRMIKGNFLRATSVGFMPQDFAPADTEKDGEERRGGIDFKAQELLEFSVVPIPSNPDALIEARAKGIDTKPLLHWFEEALDHWTDYKGLLLIPRKDAETYVKRLNGQGKQIHLSKKEQDNLADANLQRIKEQEEEAVVPTVILESNLEKTIGDPVLHTHNHPSTTFILPKPTLDDFPGETKKTFEPAVQKSACQLPHIASKIFNTPLLIHQDKLNTIMSVLGGRLGVDPALLTELMDGEPQLGPMKPNNEDGEENEEANEWPKFYDGYDEKTGVATIKVHGTLVNRGSWLGKSSGLTCYEGIETQFTAAIEDPEVFGILLDIDSNGGEAAGCFDLSDLIYESRGAKPVWASVADNAFSAAYAIASAADTVTVTRSGGVGSIGVVCLHADMSGADKKRGISYTYIHAGDHKVDGNPHEPLTEPAKARLQEEVDDLYDIFVDMVARNRGVTAEEVKDTEAKCFFGRKHRFLADQIMPLSAARKAIQKLAVEKAANSFDNPDEDEEANRYPNPDPAKPQHDGDEDDANQYPAGMKGFDDEFAKKVAKHVVKEMVREPELNSQEDVVHCESDEEVEVDLKAFEPEAKEDEIGFTLDPDEMRALVKESIQEVVTEQAAKIIQDQFKKTTGRID